jgi:Pentapeptide repeats (8 copies)
MQPKVVSVRLRLLFALLAAALGALVIASMVLFPAYLVERDLDAGELAQLPANDLADAINDRRTVLLQGIAGALFFVTAFFTWRQIRLAREGQITERFTRAVDQLGSKELPVRVGGIYALERIVFDSARDRVAIAEIFSTYLRQPPNPSAGSHSKHLVSAGMPPDVQAVLRVLARRKPEPWEPPLDLSGVNWQGFDFAPFGVPFPLRGAIFTGAHLEQVSLRASELTDANFIDAFLDQADFQSIVQSFRIKHRTQIARAKFQGVHAGGALFTGANLSEAWFEDAVLTMPASRRRRRIWTALTSTSGGSRSCRPIPTTSTAITTASGAKSRDVSADGAEAPAVC